MKRIQKCMRRMIAYANKMEQSQKPIHWVSKGFVWSSNQRTKECCRWNLPARYQESDHNIPDYWIPETVILEGMFIIPLHSQQIMAEALLWEDSSLLPQGKFWGFDNPGNQPENHKVFEQSRRDTTITSDHMCTVFFDDTYKMTRNTEM